MTCSEAGRVLYPNPEQAESTIARAEALEHLASCATCAEEMRRSVAWGALLRERLPHEEAPESLRESLHRMATDETPATRPGRLTRRALPAAIVAGAAGAWWLLYPRSDGFFRQVCEDHAKYLAGQSEISSADPAAIEAWFQDQTGFAVHVPRFEQASLRGGRLCFLRGKRAALVFYRRRERPVSLFQFPAEDVNLRELEHSVIDGAPVWRGSYQGFNVTAFEQRGMIYTLVSDLRESELLQLASAAQAQSRGR